MIIKPFFYYYGGKWRTIKSYPKPVYNTIIEPFAGAASYSLHYSNKKVLLYEINPKVFSVWDYLIKVKEDEIRNLPTKITDLRNTSLPQEQRWLIGFWLNQATASPSNKPGRWMRDGIRPLSYWGFVVKNRIANQLKYIRHWKIVNKSYEECPNQQGTWFVDAPYQGPKGKAYPYHNINYDILGNFCKSRQGQVIVCEGGEANWLPFRKFLSTKNASGSHKKDKVSKEVVWTKCDKPIGFGLNVC